MSDSNFRKTMRWVLSEGSQPDEVGLEPDEHLGQWVLPDKRGLGEIEPDTPLEKSLWDALDGHYLGNNSEELASIWNKLMELSQAGLYKDWLQPPTGPVYRGITVRPTAALKILDVSADRLFKDKGAPQRLGKGGVYRPWASPIGSWTTSCKWAQRFATLRDRHVSIIFRAQCAPNGAGGGEFLMNPRVIPDEFPDIGKRDTWFGKSIEEEEEVISYGPVEWEDAMWLFKGGYWEGDEGSPPSICL